MYIFVIYKKFVGDYNSSQWPDYNCRNKKTEPVDMVILQVYKLTGSINGGGEIEEMYDVLTCVQSYRYNFIFCKVNYILIIKGDFNVLVGKGLVDNVMVS